MDDMPKVLRLKEKHPTAIKFERLCQYAEDLGISIDWHGLKVFLYDKDRDSSLPPIYLQDIEENHWITSFPPTTEYYLLSENPEYLALRAKEEQERLLRIEEEKRARALQLEEKIRQEELARQAQLEASERALLESLKKKYESASSA
jgi:hypothetical protein